LSESLPVLCNQWEFGMARLFFFLSDLPKGEIVSDCLKGAPQKPVVTSNMGKPPTEDQSCLLNKKIICKSDLGCTVY
jgi:hypothetical protein